VKFDYFNEIMPPEFWTEDDEQRVYAEALEQIRSCEQAGFHEVWVAEHQMPGHSHVPNPEILFGAWAQHTQRIRFGFGVQLLPGSHPIAVAARTAMADVVTGGRIDVGTGRNVDLRDQLHIDMAKTRPMWEESIHLLPELWTKHDVTNADGEFWPWTKPWTVVPRPVQKPHPPLWVAAISIESAARAGETGLGCACSVYTSYELAGRLAEAYKSAAAEPKDQIGQVYTNQLSASSTWICHEEGDEEARSRIRRAVLDTRFIRMFRGEGAPPGEVRFERGGLLPNYTDDEVFTKGSVRVGSPAELIEHFRSLERLGFDRALINMAVPSLSNEEVLKSIDLFGREIIPVLGDTRTVDSGEQVASGR
jgi:alkanesulfonate monooxygenase SsuD/methylene tetrahydromethanopterin reductase-like flavin-dependent oxidoreductase (luciferase family)